MSNVKTSSRASTIGVLLFAGGMLIIAGLLLLNRQHIADRVNVWQYAPTSEIASLADRTSMTDEGRFLFYASTPVLEQTSAFNTECRKKEPESAVLGCYTDRQIYIFDIQDERLDGIREVTAAHEMLHAVYERLSERERRDVHVMIDKAYNELDDDLLRERMALYERTQPGSRYNELHSILGTERIELTNELEEYYRTYFIDRQVVTKLHESYSSVFTQLSVRGDEIRSELSVLGDRIDKESVQYNLDANTLSNDIEAFNRRAERLTAEEYDSLVVLQRQLTERTTALQQTRSQINELVD